MIDPRVALMLLLPPKVAAALALPGGLAPAALHITVAYLGRRSALPADPAALVPALESACAAAAPLRGQVGGLLRFAASETSDGLDPLCACVDLPGLVELREEVRAALAGLGVQLAQRHGFVPHVHLLSLAPDAPLPVQQIPAQDVAFAEVVLRAGDRAWRLPLGPADEMPARYQRCFRGPSLPLAAPVTPEPRVGVWDQCLRYGIFQKPALDGQPLLTRFDVDTCAQMLEDWRTRSQDLFLDKFHEVSEDVTPEGRTRAELDRDLYEWGTGHALAWYSALAHVHDGVVVGYAAHPGAPEEPPALADLLRPDGKPPGDGLYALRTQLTPAGLDPKEGIVTFRYVSPYFVQTGDSTGYRLLNITATNDPYLEGVALAMSREPQRPSAPKETPMPTDMSAIYQAAKVMETDTPEQKLEKLAAYAKKMEDDLAAKMAAGGAAAAPVAGAAEAGGAAPFAGKETAAEEKAEKAVQQAMERRVVGAEKAAAEAAAEVEKLKAERQAERVQQFTRWAISGPVEEGGGRWPAEDEKGLQEMIKDFGGDLDKARKHVLRLPVPQAMGRLTRGGNPAGATAVEPNTLAYQTMTRDSKAQTFSRLTREAMQKNPKLTLAEAQVLIEREHPGLYTA